MRSSHPSCGLKVRSARTLDRLFPERQVHFRSGGRIRFIRLSKAKQVNLLIVVLALAAWGAFSTASYLARERVLAAKDDQIANARLAYRSLLSQVANYQKKFIGITRDLEENNSLMLRLVEKNVVLQQNLKSVENRLVTTEQERARVIAAREQLKRQLTEVDDRMRALASNNFTLKDNLDTVEVDLQQALAERNQALYQSSQMHRQIRDLEARLSDMEESQAAAVQRLTDGTNSYIETMKRVVALTGLQVDPLLRATNGLPTGQGGPFIAVEPDEGPGSQLKAKLTDLDALLGRSEALQDVMAKLPLAAPLDSYYVTSGFGKRRDPINKRWAAHYGLDLGGPFKSPVYVTAPGVVTYVGWKGRYGRLIEVSHGAGLKTRYGHLNKILVKKGQKVKYRQKIGLLGSTGRSTGAHLHYEIVFRGKAMNPIKFIKAGRYVFQN